MRKIYKKRIIFTFFCVFFLLLSNLHADGYSASIIHQDKTTSDALYKALLENEINVYRQSLIQSDEGHFPENLIITINATSSKKEVSEYKGPKKVIFAFTQDFAYSAIENIIYFCKDIKEKKLPYTTIILLSTGEEDFNFRIKEKRQNIKGTKRFLEDLIDEDSTCAIVVTQKENEEDISYLTCGSRINLSPYWLVRTVKTAHLHTGKKVLMPRSFSYLYSNGVFKSNERLLFFFQKQIASISLSMGKEQKDFSVLEETASLITKVQNTSWNRHYSYLPIGNNGIWQGEAFYTITYIIFAAIVLFNLCFFSFINRKKRKAILKDFSRSAFLMPAVILFGALLLEFFQIILSLMQLSSVSIFGLKITFMSLFLGLALLLQLNFKYRFSINSLEIQVRLAACLNLLLFCAVDISLVFIFFTEYLLISLCLRAKKIHEQIIAELLLFLPFIYLYLNIINFSQGQIQLEMANTSFIRNTMLSMLLFPILTLWQRIMFTLDIPEQNKKTSVKKIIIKDSRRIISSCLILSLTFFILTAVASQTKPIKDSKKTFMEPEENASSEAFEIDVKDVLFMNSKTKHLTLSSNENIIRYVVTVSSEDVPVYESNYDYEFISDGKISFNIPDYPEGRLEIIFSCPEDKDIDVNCTAYLTDKDEKLFVQRKNILLKK